MYQEEVISPVVAMHIPCIKSKSINNTTSNIRSNRVYKKKALLGKFHNATSENFEMKHDHKTWKLRRFQPMYNPGPPRLEYLSTARPTVLVMIIFDHLCYVYMQHKHLYLDPTYSLIRTNVCEPILIQHRESDSFIQILFNYPDSRLGNRCVRINEGPLYNCKLEVSLRRTFLF